MFRWFGQCFRVSRYYIANRKCWRRYRQVVTVSAKFRVDGSGQFPAPQLPPASDVPWVRWQFVAITSGANVESNIRFWWSTGNRRQSIPVNYTVTVQSTFDIESENNRSMGIIL